MRSIERKSGQKSSFQCGFGLDPDRKEWGIFEEKSSDRQQLVGGRLQRQIVGEKTRGGVAVVVVDGVKRTRQRAG